MVDAYFGFVIDRYSGIMVGMFLGLMVEGFQIRTRRAREARFNVHSADRLWSIR